MIKIIALLPFLMLSPAFASEQKNSFALKVDQEAYITDTNGVLIPSSILNLIPSNQVRIYLTDGTMLTGIVKSVEMEDKKIFKVFGELNNRENSGFGFVLTKDGIFAGAVVFRNQDMSYEVTFSESLKQYILVRRKNIKATS